MARIYPKLHGYAGAQFLQIAPDVVVLSQIKTCNNVKSLGVTQLGSSQSSAPSCWRKTQYLRYAEDLHGVIGVEKPFLELFSEVLDDIERVQGRQEPLQDRNTGGHLLPGQTQTRALQEGDAPRSSAVPRRARKGRGSSRSHEGRQEGEAAELSQARRAAAHRSLTLRRVKSAARWRSLRRARRAAGGTACRARRSARSSSSGASRRAARSSSSDTASAILAPPGSIARAHRA